MSALLTHGETLKLKKVSAEEHSVHADLFPHEGTFTARPAWQVIEAARRQVLTGELSLATTPTTHVYLRDGQVYFAERTTDGGLGVRLLVEGVITRQQLGKGALLVGGVEHLGRMFLRDPSIDRQSVELCVELMTDDVLTNVANDVVEHYTMTMYKRHANGIDRWLPTRIEVITHIVEGSHLAEPDSVITPAPVARTSRPVAPEPVTNEPVVEIEPVAVEPVVEIAPVLVEIEPERNDDLIAALALAASIDVDEPHTPDYFASQPITTEVLTTEALFSEELTDDDVSLAQSAVDAMMTSAIADEVAEAVRRALAAIDAATMPLPTMSPSDFEPSIA